VQPLQAGDPERIGRFLLRGRLGAGGMGRVYLGVAADGTQAAIKVIRDELAGEPGFRQRFRREVAAATAVAGMFTARVLDADPDADSPWLATQFVGGPTLQEAVRGKGPLTVPNQLRLARELAEALSAIHAAGLVHRDLKPANVLLSPTGAKVIDFGIAHAHDSTRLTTTGSILGTPEYMAPEQVLTPDSSGPAADVFAFGSTLAFAATGRSPFGTDQPASTLYRIVNLAPDLVGVPPATAATVRACLDKDPARRPVAAALASQLRAEPATTPAGTRIETAPALAPLGSPHPAPPFPHPHAGGPYAANGHPGAFYPSTPYPATGRTRSRVWPALLVAGAVLITVLVTVAVAANARRTTDNPGPGGSPTPTSNVASPAATSAPGADPDSPQVRYVDRLCASGDLLTSLANSATSPQPSGDPAVARRDFLSTVDRSIAAVDAALADMIALRDDAPTPEIRVQFGLIVNEFTSARQSFTKARAGVAASDPLTVDAYRTGISRFTDGVRNLSLAVPLMQNIKLPPDYVAASSSAPHCTD
jgi:serine/threonine protein kinase